MNDKLIQKKSVSLREYETSSDPEEVNEYKNFTKNMNDVLGQLKDINLMYFDTNAFVRYLVRMTRGITFFYNKIVDKQSPGNPSKSFYTVQGKRPLEGQIASFDLGFGYPKELYDYHWCYILKDFGSKFVIIPATSVKDNSKANPNFEIDAYIKDFNKNDCISRLHVDDIRTVDIQRLDSRQDYYDLVNNKEYIKSEVSRILLNSSLKIICSKKC